VTSRVALAALLLAGCAARLPVPEAKPPPDRVEPTAPATPDSAVPEAGHEQRSIRGQMRGELSAVAGCYEERLRMDSDLEGTVSLAWWIRTDGTPRDVVVLENSTGDAALAGCLRAVVEGIRFDPPREPVEVDRYPFIFSSR